MIIQYYFDSLVASLSQDSLHDSARLSHIHSRGGTQHALDFVGHVTVTRADVESPARYYCWGWRRLMRSGRWLWQEGGGGEQQLQLIRREHKHLTLLQQPGKKKWGTAGALSD